MIEFIEIDIVGCEYLVLWEGEEIGKFEKAFNKFTFSPDGVDCLSSSELHQIADKLDELNRSV